MVRQVSGTVTDIGEEFPGSGFRDLTFSTIHWESFPIIPMYSKIRPF